MWKGVLAHLNNNRGSWEDIPAFVQKVAALESKITALNAHAQVQLQKTNGVTGDKQAAVITAADSAMMLVNALQVLAADQADGTLAGNLNYSRTGLQDLKDSDRNQVLQWIYEKAAEKLDDLAAYGITTGQLESLSAAIAAHDRLVVAPRGVQTDKSGATSGIAGLVREGNALLDQLDRLVANLQTKAPVLAAGYDGARKIILHGTRHRKDQKGGKDVPQG